MSKIKHQVYNLNKSGVSISLNTLKDQLGILPGDMVFAVMANGRILLKKFSPNEITDETDMAILGVRNGPSASEIFKVSSSFLDPDE